MMRPFFFVALSIISFSVLKAQSGIRTAENTAPLRIVCTTVIPKASPLVVIDGFETDMQSIALNPDNIKSIRVEKSAMAIKEWGEKAKDGAIVIQTKPATTFYTITDFVNPDSNINASVKQIELNGKLLPDMKRILIDKTVFSGTMISSNLQVNEKNCDIVLNDTLVIKTDQRKPGTN